LTLQAWFDDSGTKGTGRWMSMSGLFGEAELFASIADEWDKNLRARQPGAIRYFKMDEACQLDGEFKHWKEENRNAKVRQMAKLIDRNELLEIAARVDLAAFEKVAESWSDTNMKTLKSPSRESASPRAQPNHHAAFLRKLPNYQITPLPNSHFFVPIGRSSRLPHSSQAP
jgi:hypothetical protein